jgi:hypothetical protein
VTQENPVLHHPEVGRLELTWQPFDLRNARGQQLVVGTAEPGSSSAQALTLLGTRNAPEPQPHTG